MENPYDRLIERVQKLKEIWDELDTEFQTFDCEEEIVIRIFDLDDLVKARKIIKKFYPTFTDKIEGICNVCDKVVIVSWGDEHFPLMKIWFETNVDNFPDSLKKNGKCHFKEHTQKKYTFVCEV